MIKKSFFLGYSCLLLLACCAAPTFGQIAGNMGRIQVAVTPTPHIPIFNEVAVLPFRYTNNQVDQELTDIFFQALDKTKKYCLMAPGDSHHNKPPMVVAPGHSASTQEMALSFGRSAGIRGVITGSIAMGAYAREGFIASTEQKTSTIFISMTDIQQNMPVWTLTLSTSPPTPENGSVREQLPALMEQGVEDLLDHLVLRGDIFSTRLPVPRLISRKVIANRVQVTVQPDAEAIFTSYQLLRSNARDGAFSLIQSPKTNTGEPLILSDYDQNRHGTSYYTVIGLTRNGLANIPAPPFTTPIPDRSLVSRKQRIGYISTHPES